MSTCKTGRGLRRTSLTRRGWFVHRPAEALRQRRVECRTGLLFDLCDCLLDCKRRRAWSVGCQLIEDLSETGNPSQQRNTFAGQAERIACSIPPFMVQRDDLDGLGRQSHRSGDASAEVRPMPQSIRVQPHHVLIVERNQVEIVDQRAQGERMLVGERKTESIAHPRGVETHPTPVIEQMAVFGLQKIGQEGHQGRSFLLRRRREQAGPAERLVVCNKGLPGLSTGRLRSPEACGCRQQGPEYIEASLFVRHLKRDRQKLGGIERFQQEAGGAVANAIHRGLEGAVGRDHNDFDLDVRPFNFSQQVRAGPIRQFEIERDEVDAMIVDDGQGATGVFGRENIEIFSQNLSQSCAGRSLIVDDEDRRLVVGRGKGQGHSLAVCWAEGIVKEFTFVRGGREFQRELFMTVRHENGVTRARGQGARGERQLKVSIAVEAFVYNAG